MTHWDRGANPAPRLPSITAPPSSRQYPRSPPRYSAPLYHPQQQQQQLQHPSHHQQQSHHHHLPLRPQLNPPQYHRHHVPIAGMASSSPAPAPGETGSGSTVAAASAVAAAAAAAARAKPAAASAALHSSTADGMTVAASSSAGVDRGERGSESKPKQRRYRATPAQLHELMTLFDETPSPSQAQLAELSLAIGMPQQSVVLWFKNRRARVPHKNKPDQKPHLPALCGGGGGGGGGGAGGGGGDTPGGRRGSCGGELSSGGGASASRGRRDRGEAGTMALATGVSASGASHGLTTAFYHAGSTKVVPPAFSRSTTPTSYSTPYGVSHLYPPPPPHAHPHPYGAQQHYHRTGTHAPAPRRRDLSASPTAQTARDAAATLVGFSRIAPPPTTPAAGRARSFEVPVNMWRNNGGGGAAAEDGAVAVAAAAADAGADREVNADEPPQMGRSASCGDGSLWRRPGLAPGARECGPRPPPAIPDEVEEHRRAPVTPRITSQRVYVPGDKVEVLENPDAPNRAWLPALVVGVLREQRDSGSGELVLVSNLSARSAPLTLGASAASLVDDPAKRLDGDGDGNRDGKGDDAPQTEGKATAMTPVTPAEGEAAVCGGANVWNVSDSQLQGEYGATEAAATAVAKKEKSVEQSVYRPQRFLSPVRSLAASPEASPTRANSRVQYVVECMSAEADDGNSTTEAGLTREVVSGSRLRPEPPWDPKWKPYVGQAVEVLEDSTWRIAELRSPLHSRGYQTRRENGVVRWTPSDQVRPYRKWKGDSKWQLITKLPVTLLKHATDFGSSTMDTDSEDDDDDDDDDIDVDEAAARQLTMDCDADDGDDGEEDSEIEEADQVHEARPSPSRAGAIPSITVGACAPFVGAAGSSTAPRVTRKRGRDRDFMAAPRASSKVARIATDASGPDGLPPGWICERVERAAGILAGRVDQFYVAPDGRRHRSLREALRSAGRT